MLARSCFQFNLTTRFWACWRGGPLLLGLWVLILPALAAPSTKGTGDSLSLEQFLGRVRQNHPVITQARILADQGLTQIQEARG
ncbi:MAG: hypothetical protein EBS08_07240, partial [Cytophagia bacterium]|nr:hypothetical protein [Cytophagia bacterium]